MLGLLQKAGSNWKDNNWEEWKCVHVLGRYMISILDLLGKSKKKGAMIKRGSMGKGDITQIWKSFVKGYKVGSFY